jgi:signal transduction histidine kinase
MIKMANRKSPSISSIHNIKETSKRATQFCYVAIFIALLTIIVTLAYGMVLSTMLGTGLFAALLVMVWLNLKGNPKLAKYCLVFVLNAFLVIIAFAQGLDSASTLYFLPLLFAIPFFIDDNKTYKLEVSIFFSITLICFSLCLIFCGKTSKWQPMTEEISGKLFLINSCLAFLLCAIFAYLSIYLERKYAYELVRQINKTEEAMDARTRFLSSMGHELRTPLNGIVGATNLLRSAPTLPEQKDYLDILKYCSNHMLGLVNDILDFNKIEAEQLDLHPVQCNIKKLLKQSTLPFYNSFEEKNLALQVVVHEELSEVVLIDDLRLVQVINNLLSNALKFTEVGFVKLEVTQKEIKNGLSTIKFVVQDSGIGIREADQEKIFGSFWQVYNETTRKYSGTGLGLTICQRLLKLMKSNLTVESETGIGTTFSFTLTVPVVAGKKEKIVAPQQNNRSLEGVRILLAEDNIINMMIAKKFLEDKNAILTTAQNGQEALDCLNKNAHFHLVLLDLEMPVMDGYSAISEIRKKYPHLPVVAFTAALMDQQMFLKLHKLGFNDCILKPFQPLDFFATVRKNALPLSEVASYD